MRGKTKYFYFIIAGLLILVYIVLFFFVATRDRSTQQSKQPLPKQQTAPPLTYDRKKTEKLLSIVQKRPLLSEKDRKIRQRLIEEASDKFGGGTSIIHRTTDYQIEYVPTPDQFMVEIRSINIGEAKAAAVDWLETQGLSKEGICNLPISFYINRSISEQLKSLKVVFNPLPEGC